MTALIFYKDALDQLGVALSCSERATTALREGKVDDEVRCEVFDVEDAILKARKTLRRIVGEKS